MTERPQGGSQEIKELYPLILSELGEVDSLIKHIEDSGEDGLPKKEVYKGVIDLINSMDVMFEFVGSKGNSLKIINTSSGATSEIEITKYKVLFGISVAIERRSKTHGSEENYTQDELLVMGRGRIVRKFLALSGARRLGAIEGTTDSVYENFLLKETKTGRVSVSKAEVAAYSFIVI